MKTNERSVGAYAEASTYIDKVKQRRQYDPDDDEMKIDSNANEVDKPGAQALLQARNEVKMNELKDYLKVVELLFDRKHFTSMRINES